MIEAADVRLRRLTRADFPLLASWLAQPYVHRWWFHESSAEGVERDFGPGVDGHEPGEDLLALVTGEPIGLLQRSVLDDYPEYRDPLRSLVDVPEGAVTIDYLVGVESLVGTGVGTAMVRAAVAHTWVSAPDTPAVIVAVQVGNTASWRVLEKAGFHRVGEGDLEPDNPVDDPHHVVYRLDRPNGLSGTTA